MGLLQGIVLGGLVSGIIGVGIGSISSAIYGVIQIKNFNHDATNNAIQTAKIVGFASTNIITNAATACIVGAVIGGAIGYNSNNTQNQDHDKN